MISLAQDALAGSIAYAHADDFKDDTKPLTIVTASLDSVNVQRELAMDKDYRMYGFVSYVGSSSMEITIVVSEMEGGYGEVARQREQQQTTSEWPNESLISQVEGQLKNAVMTASFTMVGRDPKTGKAAKVNRLALESDFERKVFALGEQHKRARLLQSQKAPDKQKPNEEEMRLIHDIYLETKPYKDPSSHLKMPADKVWMKDTVRQSIQFSFPQDRNIHGNIFGGWLMKQAYELAFSTGLMFCRTRPTFVLLEEVVFKKPVSVGSLLYFTGQVVYTDANCFQVKVKVRSFTCHLLLLYRPTLWTRWGLKVRQRSRRQTFSTFALPRQRSPPSCHDRITIA